MNWKKLIPWGICGCLLLSGCGQRLPVQENTNTERHEATTFAMDTIMTFAIYHDDGEELLIDTEQEIRRLEQMLSVTVEDSEINQLNENAGKEPVKLSEDTMALLEAGKELGKETEHCFDIAISPVVKAWGFTEEEKHVPSQEELERLLPLTHLEDLVIDGTDSTAYLQKEGMAVDLGGIAKGYASDSVTALLKGKGVESAMLSLGGNISAIGHKPDGEKWKVAVANPLDDNGYVGLVQVSDCNVVTSGGYQRYFEENGKTYHHIINPATGYPADNGLLSVTILCKSGTKADALSTALFVMGLERAEEYWKNHTDFEAIFITEKGEVIATEGIAESFTLENDDFAYSVVKRG
ncbi:MAG: FAD:protein FMN transferase [Anaerotignum sp.]|nr:FAD:protein FMN transferase [Anaerotignum sp.]